MTDNLDERIDGLNRELDELREQMPDAEEAVKNAVDRAGGDTKEARRLYPKPFVDFDELNKRSTETTKRRDELLDKKEKLAKTAPQAGT